MQNINNLIQLITHGKAFNLPQDGELWALPQIISRIPWLRDKVHQSTAAGFSAYLDRLEGIPVRFGAEQSAEFQTILKAAFGLEQYLANFASPAIRKAILDLQRRRISLQYRLEKGNGGLDSGRPDLMLLGDFYEAADHWKSTQKIFWDSNLMPYEVRRLEAASRYQEFIRLLLVDETLADEFFKWVIRDGIDPVPFIEFPHHTHLIMDAELNGRIGRMGGKLLRVVKSNGLKLLTLLFEGEPVSILDLQHTIKFKGGYELTIQEIFDTFRNKKIHAGNLECFPAGIINWNAHCLGLWNQNMHAYEVVDVTVPQWWNQLPVFDRLSVEEARDRYGSHIDGKSWNLSVRASREYFNLNFEKTHAYLEIAIPDGQQGYCIYDFGKFATKFPANMWEIVTTISVSVQATIAYPDENVFYTHRQHIGYSFPITPQQGLRYMDAIKDDILLARTGNIVFNIESENCGRWIQSRLEDQLGKENVPNLFRMHMVDTEPAGIWKWGWELTRLLPKNWQTRFMAVCQLPLGAWKGCWVLDKEDKAVWKSLSHSPYWDDGMVYLPSLMHKSDELGILSLTPARRHTHFSTIKELTHQGIKMEKDPFASLDLFDKEKAA